MLEDKDYETGYQLHARLLQLRDHAGASHYQRVQVANRLLKNKEWVEALDGGGGNVDKALTRLEQEAFPDLCGSVGLCQLLDLLHNFPDVEVWKKNKFDFRKMWADWKAKQKPTPAKANPRPAAQAATKSYTPPFQLEDLTPAKQKEEYRRVYAKVESDAERIARLEAENARLKAENATLKEELRAIKEQARKLIA